MIRVLLVDDSPAIRAGLGLLLATTPDLSVVGVCSDGSEVVAAAAEVAPDVVLMDVSMPGTDGITATSALLVVRPSSRVLILTTSTGGDVVHRAAAAGAVGFLQKSAPPDELLAALRVVAGGGSAWSS